jgi:hypothetical protein
VPVTKFFLVWHRWPFSLLFYLSSLIFIPALAKFQSSLSICFSIHIWWLFFLLFCFILNNPWN